jgi:hypothetical protein
LALLTTESPRELLPLRGKIYHVALGPRSLPQGAPTSPSITNGIFLSVDHRIARLARKLGFRYTRYADDLTFSWHAADHQGPKRPSRAERDKLVGTLIRTVHKIAENAGFLVHPDKTRIMRSGRRQKVTGLVVNQVPSKQQGSSPTPRVPRAYVRRLRAAIHNRMHERELPPDAESIEQLRGMAAYVAMADPARGRELLAQLSQLPPPKDSR